MNSKKLLGLILAIVFFLVTAISGVVSAYILNEFWCSFGMEDAFSDTTSQLVNSYDEDLALIYVVGDMYDVGDSFEARISGVYLHQATLAQIEELSYDDNNKGILLYLDTPGGAAQVGDELYLALMEYKEITGRPIYSYIHSMGASAGYYAACATDTVVMNRNALTGSIGTVISLVDYSGLYEKLGIVNYTYTSGDFKSFANEEDQAEQDEIYQGIVDSYFDRFVDVVALGRNMSRSQVLELADGRPFVADQALENGMIDVIGDFNDTLDLIKAETGYDVYYYEFNADLSIFDGIFSPISNIFPKSETQILTELLADQKPMEVLYELQD